MELASKNKGVAFSDRNSIWLAGVSKYRLSTLRYLYSEACMLLNDGGTSLPKSRILVKFKVAIVIHLWQYLGRTQINKVVIDKCAQHLSKKDPENCCIII